MAHSIITYEDLLKEKVADAPTEKLVINLFSALAELIGNTTLNETFQKLVQRFTAKYFDSEMIRMEQVKRACENIYYIVGFYLKQSQIKYTEFLKAVSDGFSFEIIKKADQYFNEILIDAHNKINDCRKLIDEKDISYKYYQGFLNSLEKSIGICQQNIVVNLSDITFCEEFMNSKPIFISSLLGITQLFNCIDSIKNELIILKAFSKEERNLVFSAQNMQTKEDNLCDKMLSQFLLGSIYSNGIYISKVDSQLLLKEMKNGTITEDELTACVDNLHISDTDALSYLMNFIPVLKKRINYFKEYGCFFELFAIIEEIIPN